MNISLFPIKKIFHYSNRLIFFCTLLNNVNLNNVLSTFINLDFKIINKNTSYMNFDLLNRRGQKPDSWPSCPRVHGLHSSCGLTMKAPCSMHSSASTHVTFCQWVAGVMNVAERAEICCFDTDRVKRSKLADYVRYTTPITAIQTTYLHHSVYLYPFSLHSR